MKCSVFYSLWSYCSRHSRPVSFKTKGNSDNFMFCHAIFLSRITQLYGRNQHPVVIVSLLNKWSLNDNHKYTQKKKKTIKINWRVLCPSRPPHARPMPWLSHGRRERDSACMHSTTLCMSCTGQDIQKHFHANCSPHETSFLVFRFDSIFFLPHTMSIAAKQ